MISIREKLKEVEHLDFGLLVSDPILQQRANSLSNNLQERETLSLKATGGDVKLGR